MSTVSQTQQRGCHGPEKDKSVTEEEKEEDEEDEE
jgi:hypothetical protein